MGITNHQLELLETRPQRTKLWLSIYEPSTVLACRVDDASIAKGERSVTYDGVTSGSYLNVHDGMVLYVGTSAGDDDKGRLRVKSATSSVLEVAENSHIDWEDNDYLTVVNFYEITAIYPRIIQDPADPTDVIFYKDYDIEYTNQNTVLGTFVNMGSHYAGFVDPASGFVDVYYSASGSSYVGATGTSLAYEWLFEGGDPTGSTSHTPGYVSYDTPGHYTTRLLVSGSSGAMDRSYRHVSIYDRPGEGSDTPILSWELNDLSGDRDGGGYTGRITIREDIPEETIKDGSLVVIFADDWYGDTKESIGRHLNRDSVVFVGYILDGTINYDWQEKSVEFAVGSATEVMKNIEGFSVSVESKNAPSTWFQLKDMTVEKALYHYLRWHSTVLKCTDFEYPDEDFRIQFFDSDRESLYSAINTLMEGTVIGKVVSDRQGKIWSEIEVSALESPTDDKEVSKLILDNDNWRGTPIIEERQTGIVSYLEMGGIQYNGPSAGTSSAYLSEAPGNAPNYRGSVERHQGLALTSQSQLNTLCGNVFAYRNARYPSSSYNLAGNYRNYDIAPQQLVSVTLEPEDTPRRLDWNEKNFTLQEMDIEYDPENEVLLPSISLSEVTSGTAGDTIIIPPTPPTAGDNGGGFRIAPLQLPPLPSLSNIGAEKSAKYFCAGDFPLDDVRAPGFDISEGNWGDMKDFSVVGAGLDPGWENGIALNDDGKPVIGLTGKYLINVTMTNYDEASVRLAWSKNSEASRRTLDRSTAYYLQGNQTFHLNAGDIVRIQLYNGEVGSTYISGDAYISISLIDSYVGIG